jgi:hypothetical protein
MTRRADEVDWWSQVKSWDYSAELLLGESRWLGKRENLPEPALCHLSQQVSENHWIHVRLGSKNRGSLSRPVHSEE